MLGIFDVQVHWPFAAGIAQVVQDPNGRSVSPGLAPAEGTPFPLVIPAPPFNPGWRQFLYPRNTFARIGNVISGACYAQSSRRSASEAESANSPQNFAPMMLQSPNACTQTDRRRRTSHRLRR